MKRIYNLAAALLVSSVVFGQRVYDPAMLEGTPFPTVDLEAQYQKLLKEKREKQQIQRSEKDPLVNVRVSHADERINDYFGTTTNYVLPILPDSVATQTFNGSGTRGVPTHAMGAIFDPTSQDFVRNDLGVASRDTYTVDTVWFAFNYQVVNPTVTDTFRVHFFVSDSTTSSPGFGSLVLVQTTPYPGAPLRGINFASNGNDGVQALPTAPNLVTVDRIMKLSDTSSTIAYLPISTGPNGIEVTPGNLFGVFAYYIPGAPWTSADSYWEQGAGTNETMNAFAGYGTQEDVNANDLFAFDPTSFGSTHTLFNAGRYQIGNPAFLNDIVPPLNSSTNWVDFTYSSGNVTIGLEDYTANVSYIGNYPNPFKNATTVSYTLAENSTVQFEVTDITGKVVYSTNEGFKTKGNYKLQLNGTDFNSGIYYYSIITEAGRVTEKMIVVE